MALLNALREVPLAFGFIGPVTVREVVRLRREADVAARGGLGCRGAIERPVDTAARTIDVSDEGEA